MLATTLSAEIIAEIESKAIKVRHLADQERPVDLVRLRNATADLQAFLAEAARLQRRASQDGLRAPRDAVLIQLHTLR